MIPVTDIDDVAKLFAKKVVHEYVPENAIVAATPRDRSTAMAWMQKPSP